MPQPCNIGVRNGQWGEQQAVEYLRLRGYEILERNARPCNRDRRLEIDIVAYEIRSDTLVFVEVKQHGTHVEGERRLRSVDTAKRRRLRVVCNGWLRINKWRSGYRFDVIEVYGTPGSRAEIDHIERVELFTPQGRFVKWG